MCRFLEMLRVKKCRNLSVCVGGGGIFPCRNEYFLRAENLELPFLRSLFFFRWHLRKYYRFRSRDEMNFDLSPKPPSPPPPPPPYSIYFMLLIKIQYSSFRLFPVAYPLRIVTYYNITPTREMYGEFCISIWL